MGRLVVGGLAKGSMNRKKNVPEFFFTLEGGMEGKHEASNF